MLFVNTGKLWIPEGPSQLNSVDAYISNVAWPRWLIFRVAASAPPFLSHSFLNRFYGRPVRRTLSRNLRSGRSLMVARLIAKKTPAIGTKNIFKIEYGRYF